MGLNSKTLLVADANITARDEQGKSDYEYITELPIAKDDEELRALMMTALQKRKNENPGYFNL